MFWLVGFFAFAFHWAPMPLLDLEQRETVSRSRAWECGPWRGLGLPRKRVAPRTFLLPVLVPPDLWEGPEFAVGRERLGNEPVLHLWPRSGRAICTSQELHWAQIGWILLITQASRMCRHPSYIPAESPLNRITPCAVSWVGPEAKPGAPSRPVVLLTSDFAFPFLP